MSFKYKIQATREFLKQKEADYNKKNINIKESAPKPVDINYENNLKRITDDLEFILNNFAKFKPVIKKIAVKNNSKAKKGK